ncbi:zinc finger protein ZAT5 [Diospyros lotus]|uniref:zinc finger protein ZAT5 n=1 Tax=Diospyros lotus TaxID=55363 RepID=UPI002251E40E|nr:zinc finger protein ZAT5 [Diospyros lotus]
MEAPEEFTGSSDQAMVVKGKRTKRPRPSASPPCAAVASSSSGGDVYSSSFPSPATSGEISSSTDHEDEDMANCLILLAQGGGNSRPVEDDQIETFRTSTAKPAGFYVYECKTCNRTFPSFQALGGHRASHKKPKAEEKRPGPATHCSEEEEGQFNKTITMAAKVSPLNHKGYKVHECSICGSEFSSGQALGGHMRRHRAPPPARTAVNVETVESCEESNNKPRKFLPLDLNLPAPPEDDHHKDPNFEFTPNKQHLVFSAPALVDCHY